MSDRFDTTAMPELAYDREESAYRVRYDDDPVTTAVLAAARLTRTDPLELSPIAEQIDPEDVERYVRYRDAGHLPASTVSFDVGDVAVAIEEGVILLRDRSTAR
jgi:hypothetical protein